MGFAEKTSAMPGGWFMGSVREGTGETPMAPMSAGVERCECKLMGD